MATINLLPRHIRKVHDPLYSSRLATERHILFVPVEDVPEGISTEPTPRGPGTRWDAYNQVRASLLNEDCTPGTFHLKNQGITIVAEEIRKVDENEYQVEIRQGQGIVDGRQTYQLILEAQRDANVQLPAKQYVKFEIITGLPNEWVDEVARGLNASMQVQVQSLAPLQEALQWLKDELEDQPYFKQISWSETERGLFDVAEILCLLTCFNVDLYPNEGSNHPVVAYENKAVVLKTFEQEHKDNGGRAYKRLRPILKDILMLHDTIRKQFAELARREGHGKSDILEQAKGAPYTFPFTRMVARERTTRGALYPVLGAFRWLVQDDPVSDGVTWNGGFENVLQRWAKLGPRLVAHTVEKREELPNPDAVGRSKGHWGALHKEIAFADLMNRQASVPATPPSPSETVQEVAPSPEKLSSTG